MSIVKNLPFHLAQPPWTQHLSLHLICNPSWMTTMANRKFSGNTF